ncbi:hypothetical protein COX58_03400 [archaeon CG_4_10_14_0_2_um_filter_Archaea_38_6]|nr:MAG: hypothetical protein COS64_02725 [archaeon CG06_land_8_20_14_3_00_37_11]PJA21796.1 MAG: hypothetical protein COX58_03400 [archaeon CG_4_10_14_0_2_um_filter_Archaea_38_6]
MKFAEYFNYLCLILLLLFQFNTGLDLTHHVHNAWLFHEMILNHEFLAHDPYLLEGEQLTFTYGIIAYPVAGISWFLFSFFTIDVLMFIITIVDFLILRELLKKDSLLLGIIILSLSFHILGDTYVAHFSNMLFWLGVLMFYKKKNYWQIPIILSCINHPVYIIPSLYFVLKDKKLLAIIGALILYFITLAYLFAQTGEASSYLPLVFLFRLLIAMSPIILIEDVFREIYKNIYNLGESIKKNIKNKEVHKTSNKIVKESRKNINLIKEFLMFKIPLVYVILVVCITIIITQNIIFLVGLNPNNLFFLTSPDTIKTEFFQGFPNITGTVRTIDYLWLPTLLYTNENMTLTEGSFRENNNINLNLGLGSFYWTNESYAEFVNSSDFNYVLICVQCNPPTNEGEILDGNYPLVWSNDYYKLYSIR